MSFHSANKLFPDGLPPTPITLLLISFALPPETSVSLGSLRLSPYRVILILMLFPAINQLFMNKRVPPSLPDMTMFLHGAWAAMALVVTMGFSGAIETGGIYFIETFGAYIVARAYIKTSQDFANIVRLVFVITASLLIFAIIESLSGAHILREPFKAVFGGAGPHVIEPRLGLTRAFTSFEHPILFGVFAASGMAGAYYVLGNASLNSIAKKRMATIFLATFFSLSSGPFVALAFQLGLIGWDRITRGITGRWYALIGLFVGIMCMIALLSNRSPVLVFISYLTFSAASAYNRIHIWDYGTAEVGRHPLFGIGLNDWIRAPWMSDSMDNFWLLTTVRYGLPALIFLALTVIIIARRQTAVPRRDPFLKNCSKAWIVTFMGFLLAGVTVHFWNALMVQLFFLIGAGMSLTVKAKPTPTKQPLFIPANQVRGQASWT